MKSSPVITPVLLAPLQPLKEESANEEFKLVPSFSFANMSPVNIVRKAVAGVFPQFTLRRPRPLPEKVCPNYKRRKLMMRHPNLCPTYCQADIACKQGNLSHLTPPASGGDLVELEPW